MRDLHYFPDARRYETGTIAYSLFHAWTAGVGTSERGGDFQYPRPGAELTDRIITGLRCLKANLASPVDCLQERSAILAFSVGSDAANQELLEKLQAGKIHVALRDGRIRVSPNFFNNEAEVDRFLEAI